MTEEIIARLRSLDLSDGGSHSRLSAIASCFLEPAFGWTRGACEELRNMLIKLLEDADGNDDNDNFDDCDCAHHRCDQHQVSYDVLGNERHKAVCRLRKLRERNANIWNTEINIALGLGLDASNDDLCDRLIYLLGGDECNFSGVESYMDAMGEKSNPAETSDESTDHVSFDTSSSEDGTCPNPVRGASIIDKLDSERHKAIVGLRKVCTKLDESVWTWIEDVAIAIGAQDKQSDKYESMLPKITCRLIHLLGGDQPTLSDLYGILQDGKESENKDSESAHKMTKSAEIAKPESEDGGENRRTTDEKLNGESLIESLVKSTEELSRQGKVKFPPNEDGSLDSLKTVEEAEALIEDVKRQADQSQDSSPMRLENEIRITDELRKWANDNTIKNFVLTTYPEQHAVRGILEQLIAIADRIDEQFDRICEQQEKVLQDTIDYMCKEQDRLQERLRTAELGCDANHRLAEANAGWCDDLVDLLRDASREYKDRHYWKQVWHDRAVDMRMERDELQEKCDRLKTKVEHQREQLAVYATMYDFDAIRALKRERNEHKHRADNAEGHVKSLERRLDAAHETYCALLNDAAREFRALTAERDELQASLRKIAERAGVPHDSEFDEYSDETVIGATLAQIDSTHGYVGALEWQRDRQKKMLDEYDQTHVELPKDANGEYIHIGDRVEDNERVVRIVLTNGSWEPSVYIEKAPCLLEEHFCCDVSHYHEPTVEQVIRDLTLGKITESQAIERIEVIHG